MACHCPFDQVSQSYLEHVRMLGWAEADDVRVDGRVLPLELAAPLGARAARLLRDAHLLLVYKTKERYLKIEDCLCFKYTKNRSPENPSRMKFYE